MPWSVDFGQVIVVQSHEGPCTLPFVASWNHRLCPSVHGPGVLVFCEDSFGQTCPWCLWSGGTCACVRPEFVPSDQRPWTDRQISGDVKDVFDRVFAQWVVPEVVGLRMVTCFRCKLVHTLLAPLAWMVDVVRQDGGSVESAVLLLDGSWAFWFVPEPDMVLTVFDARCVGLLRGFPVYKVFPEGLSWIVRNWNQGEGRVLELFSGIGGWRHGLDLLGLNVGVVAIELDPVPALWYCRQFGVPMLETDDIQPDEAASDMVVLADVLDRKWWKLSLACPFRFVVFSSPRVSFSKGGKQGGFRDLNGQLLLHSLGIVSVLRPELGVGENVDALFRHPEWIHVPTFATKLGLSQVRLKVTDLVRLSPMKRPRAFMIFTQERLPLGHSNEKSPVLRDDFWRLHPDSEEPLPVQVVGTLGDYNLLPAAQRSRSASDQHSVLNTRVQRTLPLPVLMAAYRHQTELPRSYLLEKGLFTWLLQFDNGPIRFVHPREVLRLMGYGPHVIAPSDPDRALTGLGNSVAPVQVAGLLHGLFRDLSVCTEMSDVDFSSIATIAVDGWLSVAQSGWQSGPLFACTSPRDQTVDAGVIIMVDGSVHAGSLSLLYGGRDGAIRQIRSWLPETVEVHRVEVHLSDDVSIVEVVVKPWCVQAGSDIFLFSPFCAYVEILEVLGLPRSGCVKSRVHPLTPLWMTSSQQRCFGPISIDNGTVRVHSGGHRRVLVWRDDLLVKDVVRQAFPGVPEGALLSVWDVTQGRWASQVDLVVPGCLQVDFRLLSIFVEPFGQFPCPATASVGELQRIVELQVYHGRVTVRLLLNGRTVDPTVAAVACSIVGVFRARVYPLRGGALSLTEVDEGLRKLLSTHGVPDTELNERVQSIALDLGVESVQRCLESKLPWSALKQEATKKQVRLVSVLERESASASSSKGDDPWLNQDPWKNWQKAKPSGKKRMPKGPAKVDETFFQVEGVALQHNSLDALLRGETGIAVVEVSEVRDRIEGLLQRSRTMGPAVVVVLGCSLADFDFTVPPTRCSDAIVPGWLGRFPTAYRVVVLQLGDVVVSIPSCKPDHAPTEATSTRVLMFHIYKDETKVWDSLQQGVVAALRAANFAKATSVQQVWSFYFYKGSKRTSSVDASYAHGFLRVSDSHFGEMLRASGSNGVYFTPRTAAKGHDPAFRVIKTPGLSLAETTRVQDTLDGTVGLVRFSVGYGIRVEAAKYVQAKKAIFPDLEFSESDEGGDRRFRLLNVPRTFDRTMMKALLKQVPWTAKVLRVQGMFTWVVSAKEGPPARTIALEAGEIVVLEETRQSRGPIVSSVNRQLLSRQPTSLKPDLSLPVGLRSVPVPTEVKTKFEEFEMATTQRVDALESKLQSIQTQMDVQSKTIGDSLDSLQGQVTKIGTEVDDKFESMFRKYVGSMDSRFQQVESQHASALAEIKAALAQSPKVRKVENP